MDTNLIIASLPAVGIMVAIPALIVLYRRLYVNGDVGFKRKVYPWYVWTVATVFLGFSTHMCGYYMLGLLVPFVLPLTAWYVWRTQFCPSCGRRSLGMLVVSTMR